MSDRVTMKAVDTLHISNVGPDNLSAGDVFSVTETDAKQLEDRGYATRVKVEKVAPENKAVAAAPENKVISAPAKPARKSK